MQTARKKNTNTSTALPKKRVVKMEGNVAYINSGFAKQKVRQPAVAIKKVQKTKTGLVSTLFVLFVAFCALALLVSRYAVVCSIGSQNNVLNQNIEKIAGNIEELQLDIEIRDNLEYVQNTAQEELEMTYPNQDQRIYIDMSS